MQQFGLGAVREPRQQALWMEIVLDPAQQRAIDRRFDQARQVERLSTAVREPDFTGFQIYRTHEEAGLCDLDLAPEMSQPNDVLVLVGQVFDRAIEMFAQPANGTDSDFVAVFTLRLRVSF